MWIFYGVCWIFIESRLTCPCVAWTRLNESFQDCADQITILGTKTLSTLGRCLSSTVLHRYSRPTQSVYHMPSHIPMFSRDQGSKGRHCFAWFSRDVRDAGGSLVELKHELVHSRRTDQILVEAVAGDPRTDRHLDTVDVRVTSQPFFFPGREASANALSSRAQETSCECVDVSLRPSTSANRARGKVELSPSEEAQEEAQLTISRQALEQFHTQKMMWLFQDVPEILQVCAPVQEFNDATKYGSHCDLFFFVMKHDTQRSDGTSTARHVITDSLFCTPTPSPKLGFTPEMTTWAGTRLLTPTWPSSSGPNGPGSRICAIHALSLHVSDLFSSFLRDWRDPYPEGVSVTQSLSQSVSLSIAKDCTQWQSITLQGTQIRWWTWVRADIMEVTTSSWMEFADKRGKNNTVWEVMLELEPHKVETDPKDLEAVTTSFDLQKMFERMRLTVWNWRTVLRIPSSAAMSVVLVCRAPEKSSLWGQSGMDSARVLNRIVTELSSIGTSFQCWSCDIRNGQIRCRCCARVHSQLWKHCTISPLFWWPHDWCQCWQKRTSFSSISVVDSLSTSIDFWKIRRSSFDARRNARFPICSTNLSNDIDDKSCHHYRRPSQPHLILWISQKKIFLNTYLCWRWMFFSSKLFVLWRWKYQWRLLLSIILRLNRSVLNTLLHKVILTWFMIHHEKWYWFQRLIMTRIDYLWKSRRRLDWMAVSKKLRSRPMSIDFT